MISWLLLLACGFCLMRLDQVLAGTVALGTLDPDSDQYLQYALSLGKRMHTQIGGVSDFIPGSHVRAPGYPALLAVAFMFGKPLAPSITFLHFALWLFAWAVLSKELAGRLLFHALFGFLAASLAMNEYFFMVVTEWSVFCLLVVLFSALLYYGRHRSASGIFLSVLAVSALSLVRMEYVVLMPFVLLFFLAEGARRRVRSVALAIIAGLAPMAGWMSFDLLYSQHSSVGTLGGNSLAAIGPTLGTVPHETAGDAQYASYVQFANLHAAHAAPGEILQSALLIGEQPFLAKAMANTRITAGYLSAGTVSALQARLYERAYAIQAIVHNPFNYVCMLAAGALSVCWCLPLLFLCGKFLLTARRARLHEDLIPAFISLPLVHVVHTLTVSAANILHLRYYLPTAAVLLLAAAMALALPPCALGWTDSRRDDRL